MRNPSPPSSSSQRKRICLFFPSFSILRLLPLVLLLAREANCYEGSSGRINRRSMYACIVVVPGVSSLCVVCSRTHTHTLTQPSNIQRLIYQSSCVYVYVRRKRKRNQGTHTQAHTHIHPLYYLKQRFTSVRPSTAKGKRRKKEEERHSNGYPVTLYTAKRRRKRKRRDVVVHCCSSS